MAKQIGLFALCLAVIVGSVIAMGTTFAWASYPGPPQLTGCLLSWRARRTAAETSEDSLFAWILDRRWPRGGNPGRGAIDLNRAIPDLSQQRSATRRGPQPIAL